MPFLRYSHDKRGYEHVYLVQPITGRRGKVRSRILYWYRTPPNIKVGRTAFDEDVRRAIEKQYPEVAFDWPKLLATPKPVASADIERWRERRRLLKAQRTAAAGGIESEVEEAAEALEANGSEREQAGDESEMPLAPDSPIVDAASLENAEPMVDAPESGGPAESVQETHPTPPGSPAVGGRRRRRRRRRGRRSPVGASAQQQERGGVEQDRGASAGEDPKSANRVDEPASDLSTDDE